MHDMHDMHNIISSRSHTCHLGGKVQNHMKEMIYSYTARRFKQLITFKSHQITFDIKDYE